GKTEKAERLCIDAAKTIKSAIPLYTIEAALRDNHFLQNKGTVLESMTPVAGYNNTVVNISVNEIRNELKSTGNQIGRASLREIRRVLFRSRENGKSGKIMH